MSRDQDDDERFIMLLHRVTNACYPISAWIIIEGLVMLSVAQYAYDLVATYHYSAS
ncbi:MAG: hypothetical protein WED04_10115 [Promethearchaeati archaeon SRVP18_Atabeyarchaeia-1]